MFSAVSFMTYVIVTAFTPGPNNLLAMSKAGRDGLRRTLPFNFGVLIGILAVMSLCAAFSGALIALVPRLALWMKLPGAAYMLYLAYQSFAGKPGTEEREGRAGFVSGMLLQFVNPKLYLYGITTMSVYVAPYFSGLPVMAGFVCLLALIPFASTVLWAAFGTAFRRVLIGHARVVNVVMGLLLVYCAVSLFL